MSYLLTATDSTTNSRSHDRHVCDGAIAIKDYSRQCSDHSQWTDEQQALHWRSLKEINELLRPYEALSFMMDSWLVLAVESPAAVYQWRAEAEQLMRAQGRPGLTAQQVAAFVARFMPAYGLFLGGLYSNGPQRRKEGPPVLKVWHNTLTAVYSMTYMQDDDSLPAHQ